MSEADIRKYAQLMQELGLSGMEFKDENGVFVRLERQCAPSTAAAPVSAAPAVPVQAGGPAVSGASVCSPMVGVFYAAPTENSEPFVRVGDHVRRGDTLCIIEAMKLMNEVTAEQDGTIVEICVQDGQSVDYGCPLFRIRED